MARVVSIASSVVGEIVVPPTSEQLRLILWLAVIAAGFGGFVAPGGATAAGRQALLADVTTRVAAHTVPRQTGKTSDKKKATPKKKEQRKQPVAEIRGIDTSAVWRPDTEVFSAEQLVRLEPILRASTCKDEKNGCLYQENGKPGSEANFAFRVFPWSVSRHRSYLVQNDRCAAGGCDGGLFVLVDGQWRLVIEAFGVLERASSTTLGFNDLRFKPRGQAPVRLVWDGRRYREAPPGGD
jgi:hypothetical protein